MYFSSGAGALARAQYMSRKVLLESLTILGEHVFGIEDTRRNIIALSDETFMETRDGKFLNNIIFSIDDRSSDDFHLAWRLYDEDDSTRIDHEIMKKLLVIKHLYFEDC